ncbi:DnaA N-terminal domain-containing protein [Orenia marismortui]|uniref:DnaA N-terminal domain-containing protein n=1 Tax=Orenia marismortui TaxID=46469 RepID=UPI00037A8D51|nr:DnaA N-terminal domain-containing protein [Orenia marismortui]
MNKDDFNAVKSQLGALKKWTNHIDKGIYNIEKRIDKEKNKVGITVTDEINNQIDILDGHLKKMAEWIGRGKIDRLTGEISSAKGQLNRLKRMINDCKSQETMDKFNELFCDKEDENKVDDKPSFEDKEVDFNKYEIERIENLKKFIEENKCSQEELDKMWNLILNQISKEISLPSFNTWFKPNKLIAKWSNILVVYVQTEFAKDWLETKYEKLLSKTAYELFGELYDFNFVSDETLERLRLDD